ncbi:Hypothetical protein PENO1_064850 [Penicillium occitanis (nom. inval.)]|nr:Hypothetical protein PENO1_064850 [Penicillium occitanis (nom. inval.)]PCG97515.1 hypothetical protein PENOC_067540 [Penicillium occitanis (nom. inval.)]
MKTAIAAALLFAASTLAAPVAVGNAVAKRDVDMVDVSTPSGWGYKKRDVDMVDVSTPSGWDYKHDAEKRDVDMSVDMVDVPTPEGWGYK